jgi:TolB-like protein
MASIAVFNIVSISARLSEYIMEETMNIFTNMHKYNMVERNKISTILQEQNFQLSGNVSDDTIQKIGNMLGAQFVVTGSLDDVGNYYRLRLFVIAIESGERRSSTAVNIIKPNEQISFLSNNAERVSTSSSNNNLEGAWNGTWYGGWAYESCSYKFRYENKKFIMFDDGESQNFEDNEIWTIIVTGDQFLIAEDEFLESTDSSSTDDE